MSLFNDGGNGEGEDVRDGGEEVGVGMRGEGTIWFFNLLLILSARLLWVLGRIIHSPCLQGAHDLKGWEKWFIVVLIKRYSG